MIKLVVLISGNGSNLQAMIDAVQRGDLYANIAGVISNKVDAYGIERATQAGIPTKIIPHRNFPTNATFDASLKKTIDAFAPDLIVLAGFMRRLGPNIVTPYLGKMLNIHPSLLPKYPGLHTHHKALKAGDTIHGTSVHFVTEELDAGPVIAQATLNIDSTESIDALQKRIQTLEHTLYPKVIQWFAEGRLLYQNNQVYFDGKALASPILNP